jgi:hypothetical protein
LKFRVFAKSKTALLTIKLKPFLMTTTGSTSLPTPDPGIANAVRKKIISAGGLVGAQPSDLDDDELLVDDYQFDDQKFDLLCVKLQEVIDDQESSAKISCDDVSACKSVKDCVKVVTDTLSQ